MVLVSAFLWGNDEPAITGYKRRSFLPGYSTCVGYACVRVLQLSASTGKWDSHYRRGSSIKNAGLVEKQWKTLYSIQTSSSTADIYWKDRQSEYDPQVTLPVLVLRCHLQNTHTHINTSCLSQNVPSYYLWGRLSCCAFIIVFLILMEPFCEYISLYTNRLKQCSQTEEDYYMVDDVDEMIWIRFGFMMMWWWCCVLDWEPR